jgi:NAD+ synthase (glutamine-hydrolysing)
MRVAIAQINTILGDFEKNAKKILEYSVRAKAKHCELVVFPEATLFGYHPFDLLENADSVEQQLRELNKLEKKIPKDITVVIGCFTKNKDKKGRPYFNSVAVMQKGKATKYFHKQLLPTGDVFDEARFLESGKTQDNILKINGKKTLITICEDIWAWPDQSGHSLYKKNPLALIKEKFDLVLNLSASPFYPGKLNVRKDLVARTAKHFNAPMFYVNLVGAQDELIFDGASFAVDKKGKVLAQCLPFAEDLNIVDLDSKTGGFREYDKRTSEQIRQALVLGIRDFIQKAGFSKVVLGLSGGIDSALVACLAVDALGPAAVKAVMIPGPYSSAQSEKLAKQLANNLKIENETISINSGYKSISAEINNILNLKQLSVIHENLQARLRGMVLMSISNHSGAILLTTGNKSEIASGYCTLYGDMCGGLAPIADLTKRQVYELAALYNSEWEVIPKEIIKRAPTAELRPNQKDQDTLPDYDILDDSVDRIVTNQRQVKNKTDRWLKNALLRSEFKRWQAAPILKVSKHSFGRGRRWPIAHRLKL